MESVGENMLRGTARILHNETTVDNITGEDSHEHSTASTDDAWFLMFLAVIVGLISLAYAFCVFQMVRVWCCRFCFGRDMTLPETSIVHQGRVLDLNPGQRRAVLEAIFSENSKAVTEDDVCKRKQKRREKKEQRKKLAGSFDTDNDDEIPYDVEIHMVSTTGSRGTQDADSISDVEERTDDLEQLEQLEASTSLALSLSQPDVRKLSFDEASGKLQPSSEPATPVETVSSSNVANSPEPDIATPTHSHMLEERTSSTFRNDAAGNMIPVVVGDTSNIVPVATDDADDDAAQILQSTSSTLSSRDEKVNYPASLHTSQFADASKDDWALPDLNLKSRGQPFVADAEETKEEIETKDATETLSLSGPFKLVRVDSHSHSVTTTSDETEDFVCAICLSGYKEGDMVIASKYCTHLFHKDCILEWLQQHDECPCCRVDMVTKGELSKAATSLVGKTRMYKAVASLSTAHPAALPGSMMAPRTPPRLPHHGGHLPPPTRTRLGSVSSNQATPPARRRVGSATR